MKRKEKRLTVVLEPDDSQVLPDQLGMMSSLLDQLARLSFPMGYPGEVVAVDVQRLNGPMLFRRSVIL